MLQVPPALLHGWLQHHVARGFHVAVYDTDGSAAASRASGTAWPRRPTATNNTSNGSAAILSASGSGASAAHTHSRAAQTAKQHLIVLSVLLLLPRELYYEWSAQSTYALLAACAGMASRLAPRAVHRKTRNF